MSHTPFCPELVMDTIHVARAGSIVKTQMDVSNGVDTKSVDIQTILPYQPIIVSTPIPIKVIAIGDDNSKSLGSCYIGAGTSRIVFDEKVATLNIKAWPLNGMTVTFDVLVWRESDFAKPI